MIWNILNNIKSGYHHNKRSIKTRVFKRDIPLIKIFIKLNIINKVIRLNKNYFLIQFCYLNNKKNFVLKNVYKPSNKKIIKLNTLRKSFNKKNNLCIISSSKGILTSKEAILKKTGGVLISIILA